MKQPTSLANVLWYIGMLLGFWSFVLYNSKTTMMLVGYDLKALIIPMASLIFLVFARLLRDREL